MLSEREVCSNCSLGFELRKKEEEGEKEDKNNLNRRRDSRRIELCGKTGTRFNQGKYGEWTETTSGK